MVSNFHYKLMTSPSTRSSSLPEIKAVIFSCDYSVNSFFWVFFLRLPRAFGLSVQACDTKRKSCWWVEEGGGVNEYVPPFPTITPPFLFLSFFFFSFFLDFDGTARQSAPTL